MILVELQKKGTPIYLTDAGYKEFLKLMQDSIVIEESMENVG